MLRWLVVTWLLLLLRQWRRSIRGSTPAACRCVGLRGVLTTWLLLKQTGARRLAAAMASWVHTGLQPCPHGSRQVACTPEHAARARTSAQPQPRLLYGWPRGTAACCARHAAPGAGLVAVANVYCTHGRPSTCRRRMRRMRWQPKWTLNSRSCSQRSKRSGTASQRCRWGVALGGVAELRGCSCEAQWGCRQAGLR